MSSRKLGKWLLVIGCVCLLLSALLSWKVHGYVVWLGGLSRGNGSGSGDYGPGYSQVDSGSGGWDGGSDSGSWGGGSDSGSWDGGSDSGSWSD